VRFKVHGKWLRTSTKTEKLLDAKSNAVDIVTNAWFREKNQLPIVNKRFKQVAKLAIARMYDLIKTEQGKATFKTYIQAIEGYLIERLGNHNIDRIDNSVMNDFYAWRIEKMQRVPSESVINNHNAALNRVFDEAVMRGYMQRIQVPTLNRPGN